MALFLVFKGEKYNKLKSQILNIGDNQNNKIYASIRTNAWIDRELFKERIKNIIISYKKFDKKLLLIIDYCVHIIQKIS